MHLANVILCNGQASALQWQRFLGMTASLVDILHLCRFRMRPLQQMLRNRFRQGTTDPAVIITLPEKVRPFLSWWTQPLNVYRGVPIWNPLPRATLTTDASLSGWGATFGQQTTAGQWDLSLTGTHINVLETMAVHQAILHWADALRGHKVTVLSDNSTAVAYINRQGGTRSHSLLQASWDLLTLADGLQIRLRATHLAGDLNVVADALSRGTFDGNEWSLSQTWADFVFNLFGRPHVDLFATAANNKLPTFCSRRAETLTWRVDAFSLQWYGMLLYAFPPLRLIYRVLMSIRTSSAEVILIAPCWPNQPWFSLLLELLIDRPFAFPLAAKLLTQQRGRVWHTDLDSLHLSAWKLSGDASKKQAFQTRLLRCSIFPQGLHR